jgi:hypothetical protein
MRHTPLPPRKARLRRYTWPRKRRPGPPRRGQPTRQEKAQIRLQVYQRSGGRCDLKLDGCAGGVLPFEGSPFDRWHLVHLRSKRRFGWTEPPNKLCGGCFHCHIEMRHGRGIK